MMSFESPKKAAECFQSPFFFCDEREGLPQLFINNNT